MENSVKVFGEPDESTPGKWQVVIRRGDSDKTFLLASGLTKKEALAQMRLAERTALFCGATVIA